jgi:hypothetical protein
MGIDNPESEDLPEEEPDVPEKVNDIPEVLPDDNKGNELT